MYDVPSARREAARQCGYIDGIPAGARRGRPVGARPPVADEGEAPTAHLLGLDGLGAALLAGLGVLLPLLEQRLRHELARHDCAGVSDRPRKGAFEVVNSRRCSERSLADFQSSRHSSDTTDPAEHGLNGSARQADGSEQAIRARSRRWNARLDVHAASEPNCHRIRHPPASPNAARADPARRKHCPADRRSVNAEADDAMPVERPTSLFRFRSAVQVQRAPPQQTPQQLRASRTPATGDGSRNGEAAFRAFAGSIESAPARESFDDP